MRGWGLFFFFLLFLLVIIAIAAWVGTTQYRARKRGLTPPSWKYYIPFVKDENAGSATNYPSPRHAGFIEWVKGQFDKLTNKRTARGAYEESGAAAGGAGAGQGAYTRAGRGRDGTGEDDAWDTRVGSRDEEIYGSTNDRAGYAGYEEQELGLAPTSGVGGGDTSYHGGSHGGDYGADRDDDYAGYESTGAGGRLGRENPFSDENTAPSLRSVSPRPESSRGHKPMDSMASQGSDGSHKKSAFREQMG